MSRFGHLTLLMALGLCLSACEEDGSYVKELGAMWMEWPAQVQEENPVSVLIVGGMTCGAEYVRRYEVDQVNRTVLFNPYEIVSESPCVGILPSLFVDSIDVLGLRAGTYQLQSGDRVFGEVVVTSDQPDAPPLVGSGAATFVRDPDGCLRLRPAMTYFRHMLPLQDQADTIADWTGAFVTGHIIDATNPVCGVTRIFHLLSRQ
jgi:hypothetical protein